MVPPRPLSDRSIYLDTDPLHHFPAMAVAGHYNRHSHALSFCSPNCSRCAPQRQWFVSLLRSMPLHPMSVKVLFRFFSDARIAGNDSRVCPAETADSQVCWTDMLGQQPKDCVRKDVTSAHCCVACLHGGQQHPGFARTANLALTAGGGHGIKCTVVRTTSLGQWGIRVQ